MFVLGLVSVFIFLAGISACRREKPCFHVHYDGPMEGLVPAVDGFQVGSTRVQATRQPNLSLEVACEREEQKGQHLMRIWRAMPALRHHSFRVTRVG
jgi:hypothetical protein